jgi:predicted ATP-binding protein involved in virulence
MDRKNSHKSKKEKSSKRKWSIEYWSIPASLITVSVGFLSVLSTITAIGPTLLIALIAIFFALSTFLIFVLKKRRKEKQFKALDNLDKKGLEKAREKYLKRVNEQPEDVDALKKLISIYERLGEKDKVKELNDQLDKVTGEKEFEFNLAKEIRLHQLELHDLYFFDNFEWSFQPQMNVLLGRNGFGKSYLLRLLVFLLQKESNLAGDFFKHSKKAFFAKLLMERDGKDEVILRSKVLFEKSIGRVPVLGVPAQRILDKSKTTVTLILGEDKRDLRKNGAYHFLYQKSVEDLIVGFFYQLCITYLNKGKRFDIPIFNLIHKVIGELSDDEFRFEKVKTINGVQFQVDVITEGNDKPIPLQQASHGTLSVMALFGLIYEYLKAVFPNVPEKELTHQPALVFIDEVDAHLHPAWQQKIIKLLRENFPNVQFFVTAHSPLVVAGCREGEVAVLRKQENGFGVHVFEHDFIGYEAKELYEKVFEVEEKDETYLKHIAMSPFKKEIEKKINELEEKQKKKPLSEKDKKELEQLYDEIYYIRKAEDKFQQRMEYSRLRIENRKLKAKLKKLDEQKQSGGP